MHMIIYIYIHIYIYTWALRCSYQSPFLLKDPGGIHDMLEAGELKFNGLIRWSWETSKLSWWFLRSHPPGHGNLPSDFRGFCHNEKNQSCFFCMINKNSIPFFWVWRLWTAQKWFLLELPTSQITLRVEISRSLSRPVQCSVMAFSVAPLRSAVPVWYGRWPGWPNIQCWELICWRFDTPWDVS